MGKTIDILGVPYKILPVDVVNNQAMLLGEINYKNQTIRIDKSLPAERFDEVLLHEILHGVSEAVGLDDLLSESDIQALGRGLYATLRGCLTFSFD